MRGLVLPMTLLFLFALGLLAALSASSFLTEKKLAENLVSSRQDELAYSSALEHLQALFEAAQISSPGSWLAAGQAGPYLMKGRDYTMKLRAVSTNLAYQEYWDGGGWQRQSAVSLASPKAMLANLKREKKGAEDRILQELALVLSDAADENHALQESAGIYGAEAVDFSEILSDDGSELRFAYRANAVYKERAVTSLPYFYGGRDYDSTYPLTESDPARRELFDPKVARYVLKDECRKEKGKIIVKLSGGALTEDQESALLKNWQKKKQAQFPIDRLWQNCRVAFFGLAVKGITPRAVFKIMDSDGDSVIIKDEEGLFNSITNSNFRFAQLRGWIHSETLYSEAPDQTLWIAVSDLMKEKYYEVQLQDANFPVPVKDDSYGLNRNKKLILDGKESEANKYAFDYAEGKPQKSGPEGEMELLLKSPRDCAPNKRVRLNSVYFRRPDIIAVINKSQSPLMLSNWRLTAQTGSGGALLGTLPEEASLWPGARFYLTDQSEIARYEYGFQCLDAAFPSRDALIALPRESWGLDYEISDVREIKKGAQYYTYVGCGGALWEKDELIDEVAETQDGLRFPIEGGNTKNTLVFSNLRLERYANLKAGDRIRILGLPRHVEYASLTLKNEYNQVAARTKGIRRPREARRFSSLRKEKNNWRLNEAPFKNFIPAEARPFFNRLLTNDAEVLAAVDDARMADAYLRSQALSLYCEEFPASEAYFEGDWQLAGGRAEKTEKGFAFPKGSWPENFWQGQKIRFLTGELKGETFAVTGSFENAVFIASLSVPGRKRLKSFKAGSAALGPGYGNIFYAACKNEALGEWTFSNLWGCAGGELYLKGLSDAVDSGEFLEENHNAPLRPELFDWSLNAWETFPAFRYAKNDAAYLTQLEARHISPRGCLKIRLTAKNLNDPKGTRRAWFQGLAVCPPRRPVIIKGSDAEASGPIPLTVPQTLLSPAEGAADQLPRQKGNIHPTRSLFELEVSISSRVRRFLLSIGPADLRTGLRKLIFQNLP